MFVGLCVDGIVWIQQALLSIIYCLHRCVITLHNNFAKFVQIQTGELYLVIRTFLTETHHCALVTVNSVMWVGCLWGSVRRASFYISLVCYLYTLITNTKFWLFILYISVLFMGTQKFDQKGKCVTRFNWITWPFCTRNMYNSRWVVGSSPMTPHLQRHILPQRTFLLTKMPPHRVSSAVFDAFNQNQCHNGPQTMSLIHWLTWLSWARSHPYTSQQVWGTQNYAVSTYLTHKNLKKCSRKRFRSAMSRLEEMRVHK